MPLNTYFDALYIGGQWIKPANSSVEAVINPASEEVIGEAPVGTVDDAERAIAAARKAFDEGPWPECRGWKERPYYKNFTMHSLRAKMKS